jgi:CHAT domain-containing protein
VLDTVSVSYVPNARALRAARRLAGQVRATRLLALADPWPVAADPLPMAASEAAVAAAAFQAAHTVLRRGEATFLSFEWEAAKADVLHLACHGFAALDRPLDSGLVLAGGQVTLRRLMELQLRVRLAVLSACETAQPGTELPDEVVALPTGLLQAGVAGIVASQWAVPDRATAMLMAEFYRCWRQDQEAPAAALRSAQRWLRDTTTAEKREHFRAALSGQADWLPPDVGEAFIEWLYFAPDGLGHADIHHWGAFAHVGA